MDHPQVLNSLLWFLHLRCLPHVGTHTDTYINSVVCFDHFLVAGSLHVSPPSYKIFPSAPLWVHNGFTSPHIIVTAYTHTHTQAGVASSLIGSSVFVMLSQWLLTFSCSFPKCQLIILTPCRISTLSPLYFTLIVTIVFHFVAMLIH